MRLERSKQGFDMGQLNQKQKALFVIFGALLLITGIVGVVIVMKSAAETGEIIGLVSDRPIGVASVLVLIGGGVFVLGKALRVANQNSDKSRGE